ncbi:hypothetical protein AVEN_91475-1 [Araneus ventricosus]|uniref:Uncharacterized protein n=1 Tax=Araneus ventricosus TaxID=182803 RepID=A0A4Y2BIN0_ARAVE|nr:hypothetical protein AVEN_91475-1 [Araneus ventricosus]
MLASGATSSISNSTGLERTGRKNYDFYQPQPPKDYDDDGDDDDDSAPNPSKNKPSQGGDYPGFEKFKGYNPYSSYDLPMYPSFAPNYKGSYPMFPPVAPPNPNQMMQMMAALSNMDSTTKPESGGLLTKLFADPNIAKAAIVPLSLVAVAVVPVLMNYMMSSSSTPMVSTIANNKATRSFSASKELEIAMANFARFARTMDGDECIQKTICRIASGVVNMPVADYIRKAVGEISTHFAKDDWIDSLGVKSIIDGVKQVCSHGGLMARSGHRVGGFPGSKPDSTEDQSCIGPAER